MLRRVVLLSGLAAAIIGFVMIWTVTLSVSLRLGTSLIWLLLCARELHLLRRAYSLYRGLRIDSSGEVRLETEDGDFCTASILPGSVLLSQYGWLRFELPGGLKFAELLRADGAGDQQWRRLQVIWRHLGVAS